MNNIRKFVGLSVLVFVLLFSGCDSLKGGLRKIGLGGKDTKITEVAITPAEQSKARLLKKIDRKYENPQAHFELGRLYQADGLWMQAAQEYRIALNFDPVHRSAQAARVKVLGEAGDAAKADLLADEFIAQASSSDFSSLRLALGFQEQGLDDYALRCYRQALRLNPNSAKINRQIGYYYLSKADMGRAQDYLRRSFQLNPNQPDVAMQLGRMGVTVGVPRRQTKNTQKLEAIIDKYDKDLK